ncbi:hypothetical protein BDV95DRAFT_602932 [Massariosphaeria phaeospora]|uniref:LPXTG-motif cell wall anchor domain protein n=1 Tax=Massariosphaeria phaeospora TaxID=100035 RepID=A0A7C8IF01_9PLEO|nr:hypothetical protein BDV95DRAFT_602932 [Massariosphaeria phaeospora]
MPAAHSRRPSGQQHHAAQQNSSSVPQPQHPQRPQHQRTKTAPEPPALLRLPSTTSSAGASVSRSRRTTNPSTPTLTPGQVSTSSVTSPSYFSPQPAASGPESRSPAIRRPPASFSGHGIDNSRGPPITLITRGNSDFARRPSQKPADFAFAQQQLLHSGLVSPVAASHISGGSRRRNDDADDTDDVGQATPQTQTPTLSRQNSITTSRRQRPMASSVTGSSEYNSGPRSQFGDAHAAHSAYDTSGTDEEQGEDLFLNIAEDSDLRERVMETNLRSDRLRSRIARSSNRQSFPTGLTSSSPAPSDSTTPTAARLAPAMDTNPAVSYRRASQLAATPRAQREQSPLSSANPLETPRSRLLDLTPKPSVSPRARDSDMSPQQFLSQIGMRRSSNPDTIHTPPNRTSTYRPSNLHYSSARDTQDAPVDAPQETASRADGTESLDSTGAPASVWDELDDLKSRIRRIELGGKTPTTSGAAVSQAIADRPRTANTSITTVSSSPKQQRRSNTSPSESTIGTSTPHRVHPLLREALVKARQHTTPAVYRVLEATASEALELAESSGSAGPQGTLLSASSILNGATIPDRQVRRKADNLCRSLTELCIELCSVKPSLSSPALRNAAVVTSRRPSVQINGESPQVWQSIEHDINTVPRSSPSRAMSRIEARRTSILGNGLNGSPRELSQEPPTPQSNIPTRLSRAGTSLHRTRRTAEEEDEDPIMRAPSRAMTDFHDTRSSNKPTRFSREYTSREPIPELQPSPSIQQPASLRRPTVTGLGNENHLLYRDNRRFNIDRQNSPAYEKQLSADYGNRAPYSSNRHSISGVSALGRSGSVNRRLRGTSTGE